MSHLNRKLRTKISVIAIWPIVVFSLTVLFLHLQVDFAHAQSPLKMEIPSSWNPVGSGSRALGMGGAFIAVADDATAASWNPGGLIQLETPELSIVGTNLYRKEDLFFGTNPEATGLQSASNFNLNYLSFAYPFSLFSRNMIVAVTYQGLFDFNRKWDFTLADNAAGNQLNRYINIEHEGQLSAVGLSYCIGLTSNFSMGVTLNFWEDWFGNNGWDEATHESTSGTATPTLPFLPPIDVQIEFVEEKNRSFSGFNANLGFLWNINGKLTIGGVIKTPFTADLTTDSIERGFALADNFRIPLDSAKISTHESVDMPLSYGIGFSYRFSDSFTVDTDIYRTEWADFLVKTSSGDISPITGLSKEESAIDPTTQVRVGGEYLFIKSRYVIPLRGGLFYDPAPAMGSPDDIYGASIGSGVAWKNIIFDVAYQYRWGNDIGASMNRDFDFSYDLEEHNVYSSLIIHF